MHHGQAHIQSMLKRVYWSTLHHRIIGSNQWEMAEPIQGINDYYTAGMGCPFLFRLYKVLVLGKL